MDKAEKGQKLGMQIAFHNLGEVLDFEEEMGEREWETQLDIMTGAIIVIFPESELETVKMYMNKFHGVEVSQWVD